MLEVSTTSKFEPVTFPSVCSWSFDQPGLGAPLMYQFEPLWATSIPQRLSAVSTMRAWRGNGRMSKLAFSRTRRPIGGRFASVSELAEGRGGDEWGERAR